MYVLAAALTLAFIYLPEHSCEGVVDDSGPRTGLYWAIHTSCMRWPTVKLAYMSAIALACRTAGTGTAVAWLQQRAKMPESPYTQAVAGLP